MSEATEADQVTPADARRIVKNDKNKVYNPVVTTREVADELGVTKKMAFQLLSESDLVNEKQVGDTHVWW